MTSQREALTPQMLQYDDFDDRGETRWLPYLVYFHRTDYRSPVINTDHLGFRRSHGDGEVGSVGDLPGGLVRLLAGSSTAMGIGATNDAATIASRLWGQYAPSVPWLNVAGRSHNSAQELLVFVLYRHLLPRVDEIVVFSGLNDLALARLPSWQRGDSGAFFSCGEWFEHMEELRARHRKAKRGPDRRGGRRAAATAPDDEPVPPLADRIAYAADLTTRHLETWKILGAESGARVRFVMQPLATWVREEHAPQEELIFGELDKISNFWALYGDIATKEAGRAYAEALRQGCDKIGVPFLDLNPVLADAVDRRNWLFVDRAHFTDEGYDIVARLLAESLSLS